MTEQEQAYVCGVISLGGDRDTAAAAVGLPLEEFEQQLRRDPAWAVRVRRAEALAEVAHLKLVNTAAQDPRHWRAAVWWLERCLPHRYAPRSAEAVAPRQLKEFIRDLATAIEEEVTTAEDRARLRARVVQLCGQSQGEGDARGNVAQLPSQESA